MTANRVLIVVAHPDDEVLGCGGSIARHHDQGDVVDVLILADGVGSRTVDDASLRNALQARQQCAERASIILGVHELTMLDYPDNRLDSVHLLDLVQVIEGQIHRRQPSIIYTHHRGDVNVDHTRVHDAVLAACRPQPGNPVRQLLFFETPSSTEWRPPASGISFAPNWFVDITVSLPRKLEALKAYSPELREFPHPRSLAACEHLARWRGATVGVAAAEAFELGRLIV